MFETVYETAFETVSGKVWDFNLNEQLVDKRIGIMLLSPEIA
jgi:hypothetical protein